MNIKEITAEIRYELNIVNEEISDLKVKEYIENIILNHPETGTLSIEELSKIVMRIFYSIRSDVSILEPYIKDDDVNEVMVNGKDEIFIEKNGIIEKTDESFISIEELEEVIRRIAAGVNREINELNPIVDARLPDGSRVNAVYKNIAINGPILTIRKFPKSVHSMEDLIELGTITGECAYYLEKLVRNGYNCFISGGTSSGKTTFLNVLSDFIPRDERLIIIEDSAELKITGHRNIVRMECRNANTGGRGEIGMDELIKTALRMRPDRIIVGEVRQGAAVLNMINAMNTGHSGSLSTGHGNSVTGMLRRLESMYLQVADFPVEAIRSQIAEGIDIIIHLGKLDNKDRKVLDVSEIYSSAPGELGINQIFRYTREEGLKATGNKLIGKEKLELNGEYIDPNGSFR